MRASSLLVVLVLFVCLDGHATAVRAGGGSAFGIQSHVPGQVEASFLVNLFKFVQWPASAPLTDTATICFLRPSVVQSRLEAALAAGESWTQLRGHAIAVKTLSVPEEVTGGCRILYLDARTADQFWPFPVPAAVLTVSNKRDFAYRGGMIQFLWDSQDTYRIAIHPGNVIASGLIVSGALGTLADRVDAARFTP
jgi:YfiR/HmsC-like